MTLIDKAEALAPCPFCGSTMQVAMRNAMICLECYASGPENEDRESAWNRRAALPARGVGVPTVDELANIIRMVDGQNSLGAGALAEAILAALAPTDAAQTPFRIEDMTLADLMRDPLYEAATTPPTDAAQVREAAIRECADALRKVIDYAAFAGADPDEVEDEAINSYADYLLTLIDKPHEQRE